METTEANAKIKWSLDPTHNEIGFKVKYLLLTNVRGQFRRI